MTVSTFDRSEALAQMEVLARSARENMAPGNWATALSRFEEIGEIMGEVWSSLRCGDRVASVDGEILVVTRVSYGRDADETEVLAHTAPAVEVVLSSDGRWVESQAWHDGPEAEWVAYERWTSEGRVAHGFIDSVSRRLLQAG